MTQPGSWPDLEALRALGFGLDAALMNDPKLFVDRRFLAAILDQFERELGPQESGSVLFQVGLLHGMRDALRAVDAGAGTTGASPLAMRLGQRRSVDPDGSIEIPGLWPEAFEADARLARLGPTTEPRCNLSAGYTSGWLSGTLDANILALEHECAVHGAAQCAFVAREIEAWRDSNDLQAAGLLALIDFDRVRTLALAAVADAAPSAQADGGAENSPDEGDFDRDAHVVHLWGPVMVMPFASPEEALNTIEILSQDASTAGTRAVVVDLRESPLDDGFGAAALEQVIEVIESWGAEPILTGVSMLNEAAVSDLESGHMLIQKDLPAAIAAAFQIAEVQRGLL